MEAKGVIPGGREASSDHCLLTERVHTDRRRHTFSVSPRYRFHQELDHWRVAHRHDSHHGLCDYATNSSARNNRASEGEAVDDAREMFATACQSLVVHSDQHNSPSEDEANSDEQDETIIGSVPSVLLQGATKRRSQTMIAAVSIRRTPLRVPREVLCVGQPNAQHRDEPTVPQVTVYMFKSRGVPEMLKKIMVKLTNELRKLAGEEEAQPRTISHQYRARLRPPSRPRRSQEPQCPSRARTQDASQEEHSTALSQLTSRIPAVVKSGAGAGKLDHEPDQQVADVRSVSSQSHREVVIGEPS